MGARVKVAAVHWLACCPTRPVRADWLVGRFPLSSPLELSSGQFLQHNPQRVLFVLQQTWLQPLHHGLGLIGSLREQFGISNLQKGFKKFPLHFQMKTVSFVAEPCLTLCQAELEH